MLNASDHTGTRTSSRALSPELAFPAPAWGGASAVRTATPRRIRESAIVRLWNGVARLATDAAPELSLSAMLETVRKRTGATFPAAAPHLQALDRLIASVNETGRLHPFGALYVRTLFTDLLSARANLTKFWQNNPAVLNERIGRPLVVLGLPRSGTTFMFNLLAQDPAHRFLANWETSVSQIPPRKIGAILRDPRRRKGRFLMRMQNAVAPRLKEVHEFRLDGPEECTQLLMQSFATQALAGFFDAPAYSDWLDTADHGETYAHHKRILQTLQWTYPGERWLLKSPDHLAGVGAMARAYPDACYIHMHRDPSVSVVSWASLNSVFRAIGSHEPDATRLGDQALRRLARDMDAYMGQRAAIGEEPFSDVGYREFLAEPMATVRRLYDRFGLSLSDEAARRMNRFLDRDRQARNGQRSHRYTPEEFGLTAHDIRRRFAGYARYFSRYVQGV